MCPFYGLATTKIKALQCGSYSRLPLSKAPCRSSNASVTMAGKQQKISIAELTTCACIKSAKENKKQTIFFRKLSRS